MGSFWHIHRWSKWSEPFRAVDNWQVPVVLQRRVCSTCGCVKAREVKADGWLGLTDV